MLWHAGWRSRIERTSIFGKERRAGPFAVPLFFLVLTYEKIVDTKSGGSDKVAILRPGLFFRSQQTILSILPTVDYVNYVGIIVKEYEEVVS